MIERGEGLGREFRAEARGALLNQSAGVRRLPFGMALNAEHGAAAVDGDRAVVAGGKDDGAGGKHLYLVLATHEQRDGFERRLHPGLRRVDAEVVDADAPAARALRRAAAEGMGHHLVAEADAEQGDAGGVDGADELLELVNPGHIVVDREV